MDVRQLLKDIDSRIASNPDSTARSLAEELHVTVGTIEKAIREVDGVSFNEYLENRQLALLLKVIEDQREAENYRNPRAETRRTIPDTKVSYLLHGHGIRKTGAPVFYPIFDLSRGGMAFLSDRPLKPGRRISLFLKNADTKDPLRLEGQVVYTMAAGKEEYQYRIGVRFIAFGATEGCNPPEVLEVLTRLLKSAVSHV